MIPKEVLDEILEHRKQSILDIIENEIKITKIQMKNAIESSDKNYFSGYLDCLAWIKDYI